MPDDPNEDALTRDVIDGIGAGVAPSRIEAESFPFPGTPAARKYGCLCPVSVPRQGTQQSPLILHTNCPLHGVKAYEEHLKGPRH